MKEEQLPTYKKTKNKASGFALVEVLLAMGLFAIVTLGIAGVFSYTVQTNADGTFQNSAVALAAEGLEAVRSIKDRDFSLLADGTFGLVSTPGYWDFSGVSDTIGPFTREIVIQSISPTEFDATSTVEWNSLLGRFGSVSLSSRFTNWTRLQTVTWENPVVESTLNLTGSSDGIKVFGSGNYVYIIQGGNPDLEVFDITNPASPFQVDTISTSGTARALFVYGNYAFIGTTDNSDEVEIIDISDPTNLTIVEEINIPGSNDVASLWVESNILYVGMVNNGSDELYTYDITNINSPVSLGDTDLGGTVFGMYKSGNYLYLASSSNSQELQIVDISNPSNPFGVAFYNTSGSSDALNVLVFGNTAALAGSNGVLHLFDISNPLSPTLYSSNNLNGSALRGLAIDPTNTYLFVSGDDNSEEFQVFDVSNPSSIVFQSLINYTGDINDLYYDASNDRLYGATDENSSEGIIIYNL